MSIIRLLSAIVERKLSPTAKPLAYILRDVPLNLGQGSIVSFEITTRILAEAAGSIFPEIPEKQSVIAVGKMTLFGIPVYRSYLSDHRSFIQTCVVNNEVSEVRLYSLERDEQYAQSAADWTFLLDKEQGALGWEAFEINRENSAVSYTRMWGDGNRVDPQKVSETVEDINGNVSRISHYLSQYGRVLNDDLNEYLIPEISNEEGFNIWVGIDLPTTNFTIIPNKSGFKI